MRSLALAISAVALAGCTGSGSGAPAGATTPLMSASVEPPAPDPRVGLRAGWMNAAEASWNLRLVSTTPPSAAFINRATPGALSLANSDITFSRRYAIQGNFNGYQVWDIADPARPQLYIAYVCPGSQSDVSVFRNLMFVSGEATSGRLDCGTQGIVDTVSHERLRGIRIFDISDIGHPKYLANVQTCRGSHTHSVVTDPRDSANVYIYVSGTAPVRSSAELPGCSGALPEEDPNSALFRIEVIRVPLAAPEQAAIVSSPRIFGELTAPARHAELVADSLAAIARRKAEEDSLRRAGLPLPPPRVVIPGGPTQCHDITVYPAIGLGAGACGGYGLLLDIRDVAHPRRIGAVADSNFAYWHSATFNNDGSKVLFTDEWGGGLAPRCRSTDKHEWGADALFTLNGSQMTFQSYYKMSAPQTPAENCVAHNGSLIPVPGRDIMVQGWYQGGISVFDWTDAAHPKEIAYFDRGPMDSTVMQMAGSWSAYWYNGFIYSSEIARGLDIFELLPSGLLSQNELDAARLVHFDFLNVQDQQKLVWPPSFSVPRAYLDQLARSNGLPAGRIAAVRAELARGERLEAGARRAALTALANALHAEAPGAADQGKVHLLARTIGELAGH